MDHSESEAPMESLLDMTVTVPLVQLAVLLTIGTLVLLVGMTRIALVVHYVFLFFWSYILVDNADVIRELSEHAVQYVVLYYGFGLLIIVLAFAGLLRHKE